MDTSIIAIDGTAGSGKGLLCVRLAHKTGFHLLESGALYRLAALRVRQLGLDIDNLDLERLGREIEAMNVHFEVGDSSARTHLDGEDVDDQIRTEASARDASAVAMIPELRERLLPKQREFARPPGLVADGRDMGSRVFPEAVVKLFLKADPAIARERRWLQLREIGVESDRDALMKQIVDRDERDRTRASSPLVAAAGAVVIDTSHLDADQVLEIACQTLRERGLAA